jgi:hypothetical protein
MIRTKTANHANTVCLANTHGWVAWRAHAELAHLVAKSLPGGLVIEAEDIALAAVCHPLQSVTVGAVIKAQTDEGAPGVVLAPRPETEGLEVFVHLLRSR